MTTAIITRYLGPTNHRGARVKAHAMSARGPFVTVAWDYGLSQNANHNAAAQELARQLGWPGSYVGGDHTEGSIYVRCAIGVGGVPAFVVEPTDTLPMSRTVARRV